MRKVFDNSMTCHVWAQQTQEEGRNSKSSIFFDGPTIYSYGYHFWMGHFVKADVVLLNSASYGVTTSSHQSDVRCAVWHLKRFEVPDMGDHEKNAKYLKGKIELCLGNAEKARRSSSGRGPSTAMEKVKYSLDMARAEEKIYNDYCLEFKLKADFVWPHDRVSAIIKKKTAVDAKWDNPKEQAKRAKAKIAREKAELKKNISYIRERVAKFKGGNNYVAYGVAFPILLRCDGDTIRTSRGAEMPVKFAKAIWQMVAKCKASKTEFKPNGRTIHAGHFQVSQIDKAGNLKAGCHSIQYGILKNMARQLELI